MVQCCANRHIEYDSASGSSYCVGCGVVASENAIVSEVTFGETSSGAAMVQGSYVGAGSARARMNSAFGKGTSIESREQTLENARRKIHQVASAMKLKEIIAEQAQRYFGTALSTGFVKGRKSYYVIAVCLYVACRFKQTSHMLIDFSDMLQVNVFSLGRTYLDFVRELHINRLPLIDPVHYIHRFANLLEFGDETPRVASDAIRLVQRFSRDWMQAGRRPAGICGAALLLAARMNNFRRSVQEIIQVVKIADTTIQKRLDEFKATPSAQLTVQDFRTVTLEEAMDPPAFYQAKQREEKMAKKRKREEEGDKSDESEEEGKRKRKRKRSKKPKDDDELDASDQDDAGGRSKRRKKDKKKKKKEKKSKGKQEDEDADADADADGDIDPDASTRRSPTAAGSQPPADAQGSKASTPAFEIDPSLLAEDARRKAEAAASAAAAAAAAPVPDTQATAVERSSPTLAPARDPSASPPATQTSIPSTPLFLPSESPEPEQEVDYEKISLPRPLQVAIDDKDEPMATLPVTETPVDENDKDLQADIQDVLTTDATAARVGAELDQAAAAHTVSEVDELKGLDDAELDAYIIPKDSAEAALKERIWVEINKDYLQNLAVKMAVESGTSEAQRRKPRKKGQPNKPRDSSNPTGSSAVDSARKLVQKKMSKKINYDALERALSSRGRSESRKPGSSKLYRMDDDKTDEMLEIVEDAAGMGVGSIKRSNSSFAEDDKDDDDPDDYYDGDTSMTLRAATEDGKDDDFGYEEDMYEQEA
ncbi:hypothetical protein EXIGLDRAFT_656106 [Exidia glandulosa HHB12029]|uniref:B-related factor 1 n=1 Tax=Exidia glandulosa HHB12029 TaxID=1314781 RepID=A0A165CYM3_EXIGL|nr:hypothetical protein EXIGLDRAFT_656106 [Exidia glandulosa HHB12029]